jgi:hypothetical protein
MFWEVMPSQILRNIKQGPISSEQALLANPRNAPSNDISSDLRWADKVHARVANSWFNAVGG